MQFRAQFFDLFNRANFLGPGLASGDYNGTHSVQHGSNVSGTGFGQITADNSINGASSITAPASGSWL